jgi:uncharacterized RDD family membrane protein YckC
MNERKNNPDLETSLASPEELERLRQTISSVKNAKTTENAPEVPESAQNAKERLPSSEDPDDTLISLEEEARLILQELTEKISYWESRLGSQKPAHPRHLEIMASYHSLEKELANDNELDVFASQTEVSAPEKEVLPLFDLLDKELTSEKKQTDFKKTFSETKTIDRSDLEKEFLEFEKHIATSSSQEAAQENIYEFDYEEFESSLDDEESSITFAHPPFSKVVVATAIDFIVITASLISVFYYKSNAVRELLTLQSELSIELLPIGIGVWFLAALAGCWIFALFFFSVLYDGSPGQKLLGIVIISKDGTPAKIRQLFVRFLMHIVSVLTFGIRPLLMARSTRGFYCRFSGTCLALEKSIRKNEEDEFHISLD